MKTFDIINIDNELGKIEDNIILEVGKWRGIGIDEVKTYYYIDNNYDLYYKEIRDNEKTILIKHLNESDKNLLNKLIEDYFIKREYYDNIDPFILSGERVYIKDNLNEYKIYNNTNLTNKVLDYIDEIDN